MAMAKILVADDHPAIVRLLQRELEQEGHEVLTALDGETAIRIVREERPALVVLDVILPGKDGFEVLKAIRTDPATRDTGVIMLSVMAQDQSMAHGLHMGADWYLTKPFKAGEVATLARRFLDLSVA
jgi:DNA-binding response OmpR family regulator